MRYGNRITARFGIHKRRLMRSMRGMRSMRRQFRRISFGRRVFAVIFTVFTVMGLIWLNRKATPILFGLAESGAQGLLNSCIEQVTREISAGDILHTVTDGEGRILSVSVDADRMNRYQARIGEAMQRALEARGSYRMKIPVGTLTGAAILSGRGPRVSVRLSPTGAVSTEARSTFTSAGINQTCHRIDLTVTANITVFLPDGQSRTFTLLSSFCAAETVIVGTVPARVYR